MRHANQGRWWRIGWAPLEAGADGLAATVRRRRSRRGSEVRKVLAKVPGAARVGHASPWPLARFRALMHRPCLGLRRLHLKHPFLTALTTSHVEP